MAAFASIFSDEFQVQGFGGLHPVGKTCCAKHHPASPSLHLNSLFALCNCLPQMVNILRTLANGAMLRERVEQGGG